jgi:lysophospholipase L1-like esterase
LKNQIFSAPLVLLLAGLLVASACDKSGSSGAPSPITKVVNYDALGASDTIGYGGSDPCLPLIECTSGSGYVQQVTRRLQAEGRDVTLQNLGIPGAVLSPQVQALGNSLGLDILRNTLMDGAPYVRRTSTLVTVFIGANDANAVGRAVRNGHGGSNPSAYIQTQIQNFARDMQTLVATVRGRSPEVRIVALNLPNMAHTPYAAGMPLSEKRVLQQLTVGFSAGINALTSQGVTVVDLMCDANFYTPSIFSADGFHPNDAGYAYLTELVYAAATSSAPTPRASCAFMTVY